MTGRDAILNSASRWAFAFLAMATLSLPLLTTSLPGHAQNSLAQALQQQSEFLPVREAYQLDGAVTAQGKLRLYWQIAEGYYLYQHAFKVRGDTSAISEGLSITFPPALDKNDEFFGDVSVYYDEADLTVNVSQR